MERVSSNPLTIIQPLVDLLAIGSAAGRSSSLLINDSRGSGDSATMTFPPRSSYVEPGSYPHILDCKNQSQKQLHWQRQKHAHGEKLKGHVLKQAGTRQQLLLEFVFRKQAVPSEPAEIHRHSQWKNSAP